MTISEVLAKNAALEKENKELDSRIKEIRGANNVTRERCVQLEREIEHLRSELDKAMKEIKSLEKQRSDLINDDNF